MMLTGDSRQVRLLVSALSKNTSPTWLSLGHCGLDDNAVRMIADTLRSNKQNRIAGLDLTIRNDAANASDATAALVQLVRESTTLTTLKSNLSAAKNRSCR